MNSIKNTADYLIIDWPHKIFEDMSRWRKILLGTVIIKSCHQLKQMRQWKKCERTVDVIDSRNEEMSFTLSILLKGLAEWTSMEDMVREGEAGGRNHPRRIQPIAGRVSSSASRPQLGSRPHHAPGAQVHTGYARCKVRRRSHPGRGEDRIREWLSHAHGRTAVHGFWSHDKHWGTREKTQNRSE